MPQAVKCRKLSSQCFRLGRYWNEQRCDFVLRENDEISPVCCPAECSPYQVNWLIIRVRAACLYVSGLIHNIRLNGFTLDASLAHERVFIFSSLLFLALVFFWFFHRNGRQTQHIPVPLVPFTMLSLYKLVHD